MIRIFIMCGLISSFVKKCSSNSSCSSYDTVLAGPSFPEPMEIVNSVVKAMYFWVKDNSSAGQSGYNLE